MPSLHSNFGITDLVLIDFYMMRVRVSYVKTIKRLRNKKSLAAYIFGGGGHRDKQTHD